MSSDPNAGVFDNLQIHDDDKESYEEESNVEDSLDSRESIYSKRLAIFRKEREGLVQTDLDMLTECKDRRKRLDLNYRDLFHYISFIQTSVIFFSTASAFVQGLESKISIPANVSFIITLVISTYISLVLSLSKFFKLDERKESIHNLRERYSELNNKIRFRLDTLKPWNQEGYINRDNVEKRLEEWKNLRDSLQTEYMNIIAIKQDLFTEFGKTLDYRQRNQYRLKNLKLEIENSRLEKHLKHAKEMPLHTCPA